MEITRENSFKDRSIKSGFKVCAVIVRFCCPTLGYNTSYTQSVDKNPSQGIYGGIGAAVVDIFSYLCTIKFSSFIQIICTNM